VHSRINVIGASQDVAPGYSLACQLCRSRCSPTVNIEASTCKSHNVITIKSSLSSKNISVLVYYVNKNIIV